MEEVRFMSDNSSNLRPLVRPPKLGNLCMHDLLHMILEVRTLLSIVWTCIYDMKYWTINKPCHRNSSVTPPQIKQFSSKTLRVRIQGSEVIVPGFTSTSEGTLENRIQAQSQIGEARSTYFQVYIQRTQKNTTCLGSGCEGVQQASQVQPKSL